MTNKTKNSAKPGVAAAQKTVEQGVEPLLAEEELTQTIPVFEPKESAEEKPQRSRRRKVASAAMMGVAGILIAGAGALIAMAATGVIDAGFLGEAAGLLG